MVVKCLYWQLVLIMNYFDWRALALLSAESWAIYFTAAAQYQVAEHLRAIIIKYVASLDRGKGRGQTLDEWHVSDPLYDNYNTDHLLHYINGAALELENYTPGARLETQLANDTRRKNFSSVLFSCHRFICVTGLDFSVSGHQLDVPRPVQTSHPHGWDDHSSATSGDKALLTNYNSITMSPEPGLTSANRSMQYGNVKMSIPSNCVCLLLYNQQTLLLWISVCGNQSSLRVEASNSEKKLTRAVVCSH